MKRFLCLLLCLMLLPLGAVADRAYLIPDSNTRKLTSDELWQWDYESLGYILNEIFARHGYNFIPGEKYDYYFRCMPWYVPNANPNNQQACYSKLSSIEWQNEHLIKEVRAAMRAMNTQNEGGQSVWDYFSTGFDTLQGFHYVELKANQNLAVYSAPSKSSWRGAKGKASVSTNGIVWAAGWESGWLLVMYETNNSSVRVGYINSNDMKGSANINTCLSFDYASATVVRKTALTDDPARSYSTIIDLPQGAKVTYLTSFFNNTAWDYIEAVADGKTVRGFIPSGCLSIVETAEINIGK